MVTAKVGDTVIAQSDDTIVIEGNHYFPPDSVNMEYLTMTDQYSECPWKGQANYYTIKVNNQELENTAWTYTNLKTMALERVKKDFNNYIAFYPQVQVVNN